MADSSPLRLAQNDMPGTDCFVGTNDVVRRTKPSVTDGFAFGRTFQKPMARLLGAHGHDYPAGISMLASCPANEFLAGRSKSHG